MVEVHSQPLFYREVRSLQLARSSKRSVRITTLLRFPPLPVLRGFHSCIVQYFV